MNQLENNQNTKPQPGRQAKPRKAGLSGDAVGVAATFERKELKDFFVNYLTTILVVEGIIFFFTFVNHLATDGSVFPWKPYLFATFVTPIAITFVFGLIILTFNKYFFRDAVASSATPGYPGISLQKGDRLDAFFQVVHRLPFLLSLLLLIAATALAYKMDAIVLFAAQAGAVTAQYLFFTLVAVMVVAALGIGTWMILSYKLRQNKLTTSHQYKMQLMDQFGMVLMDDGTMLDKDGNVVYQQDGLPQVEQGEAVELIEELNK